MSWDERPYAEDSYDPGRGSGFGDNPMGWSFSVGRVSGIDIRIHFIFVLYVGMELLLAGLQSASSPASDVTRTVLFKARWMALLFVFWLLPELGHWSAARSVGGSAHEVLMWPLGGLAYVHAPNTPRAQFVTAAGGPLVNVGLCAFTSAILLSTGQTVSWHPFEPLRGIGL